ncbi:MAG: LysM peptidoglycan-binding domain-containing M23 family metallopeptidase [Rhodobacteraceae bacterium]|nr:LysM peptidoglycan-binding domain-containing M23 family metallopeptidase [Paracoccaceae bacterium]
MAQASYRIKALIAGTALVAVAGCTGLDTDFRDVTGGFSTSTPQEGAPTLARPEPDARGVISYPTYQVAVAQQGDTVTSISSRLGQDAGELAALNGIPANATLRQGEVLVLSSRVAVSSGGQPGSVDVVALAEDALAEVPDDAAPQIPAASPGVEPVRHRVVAGETAFSIARTYNVSARSLAEWNGLDADLTVREGQFLMIPVADPSASGAAAATAVAAGTAAVTTPGAGSLAPAPPSASTALPEDNPGPAPEVAPEPAAELATDQTSASDTGRLRMPVAGPIVRPFEKGRNDGIAIQAATGSAVSAADDGTVAAITRDTDQVPILVLRHDGNLLTVYAGVDAVTVEKGDRVARGQQIAKVRAADPSFLHFEVREGFESVDPLPYLK